MSEVIFLDTGPLIYAVHPKAKIPDTTESNFMQWLLACLEKGKKICIPEICDYELRRGLVKKGAAKQIKQLDDLKDTLEYIPINTPAMIKASELWGEARKKGKQTARDASLDADMILCGQALIYNSQLIIATTNVMHLSLFTDARLWDSILP